ncbi:Tat pathway signal sequence domain protein [Streptomyces sp. enrichment culture]|uniref:Tat pathway signal sequence domain protein n=1 Tax=Streptomyces sp. enrichment culture TaxID=1795815 RepID=UPI003F568A3A
MSGVGPVEPGEGTRVRDAASASRRLRPAPAVRLSVRQRRALAGACAVSAVLAGGGYLYATRPVPVPPTAPPYPAQVTTLSYREPRPVGPPGTEAGGEAESDIRIFVFQVEIEVDSGPPVTVTRISQPYAGVSVISAPRTPFRTKAGSPRKIMITLRVNDCGNVPRNAGLPFLDVTLRNTRAMQDHSFILGTRYARDLSQALQVACGNEFR